MNKCVIVLSVLYFITISFAQAPDTLWTRTYGGMSHDEGHDAKQISDGGYIIVGKTRSFGVGETDVWIIRTNSNGDTLWTKTYGGISWEEGRSIQQTSDGGYIITGITCSYGAGGGDVYLIKTDLNGNTFWTKTYGRDSSDCGYAVQQTSDGGYIIVGVTQPVTGGWEDVYVIKTDSLGDSLWTKVYGGGGTHRDGAYGVQQTSDGGYIIVGYTQSFSIGYADVWLLKTNSLGDTIWARTYGGVYYDEGRQVQQTSDGGYVIAGMTCSFGPGTPHSNNVYVIKTDSLGDTLWTKIFGTAYADYAYSIQETSDKGYIIAGTAYQSGTSEFDVYIIKTDSLGNAVWTKMCGGLSDDMGYSVQQTSDGGYIIAGYTASFGVGGKDVYMIKIAPESGIEEEKVESVRNSNFSSTIINGPLLLPEGKTCKVFDITGRVMLPDKIKPGVYFIQVDGVLSQKVIKIK